ncbi:hypothetical protein O181_015079 [Austropuccinia psidii MF-1]|uniref:Uncharacterized protein n=1 Tax=Austropuccinia psidii MF-1 TaxID=1389203 RepID=A0A9Q3BZB4_9BASI|nr:hypothetical protein [Austropuccinia psidii MF-1]
MSISLKAKTHINTIHNVWVITPHGARQQFDMLIFMHGMTSSLTPDNLTPFPCLLPCMNWLPHHLLIISASGQEMLQHLAPHLCNHPSLHFCTPYHAYTPAVPHRYVSDPAPQFPPSPAHNPLCPLPCLCSRSAL